MKRLGRQFHCFAPDLLGFGESSSLPARSYSIAAEVAALEEFLAKLRITPRILIADTLGAWVAIHYGWQNPEHLQGLILMAPEGVTHPRLEQRWRDLAWLSYPWALRFWIVQSLVPAIRVLVGDGWWRQIRQRRQQLRAYSATCRLLFQRRLAVRQGEYLNDRLATWSIPSLILQPELATPDTQIANQLWIELMPQAHALSIAGSELIAWETAIDPIQAFVQEQLWGKIAPDHLPLEGQE
jgi:haloalkane dehalogenase